ncbi:hypothetical protein Cgig2_009832 [Carnegiea gigantea]|uniref:Uncharacterized protein n=1 Tax=Carnegiea gigantea TaxID=171969 RepID=A0A9Q1QKD2_9CARY|nr:hypothetical protein Cgig2_009832 [Carnegiea gigantea]
MVIPPPQSFGISTSWAIEYVNPPSTPVTHTEVSDTSVTNTKVSAPLVISIDISIPTNCHNQLAWVVLGDLNEIFFLTMKKVEVFYVVILWWRHSRRPCGLFDLNLSGYKFTWRNGRDGVDSIQSRLGRYLRNAEWSPTFPFVEGAHVDEDFLYHRLIFLSFNLPGRAL